MTKVKTKNYLTLFKTIQFILRKSSILDIII